MTQFLTFDESDGDRCADPFAVLTAVELLAMGYIDEATMQELMEPLPVENAVAA